MHFCPVDRIFTRIGAGDRLLEGKSTFYIELEETATALSRATPRSLVIMDELGRGTSTFDGASIAYSTLSKLVELRAMTLFTTHYHMIVQDLCRLDGVRPYHLSVSVTEGEIRFLYKLVQGNCLGSFGLEVARMTGIPEEILEIARTSSEAMGAEIRKKL
jgi:DNA mismatch repair ATPase MutS